MSAWPRLESSERLLLSPSCAGHGALPVTKRTCLDVTFSNAFLTEPILIENRGAAYPVLEVSREILRELGCLLDASEEDLPAGTCSTTDVVP